MRERERGRESDGTVDEKSEESSSAESDSLKVILVTVNFGGENDSPHFLRGWRE